MSHKAIHMSDEDAAVIGAAVRNVLETYGDFEDVGDAWQQADAIRSILFEAGSGLLLLGDADEVAYTIRKAFVDAGDRDACIHI